MRRGSTPHLVRMPSPIEQTPSPKWRIKTKHHWSLVIHQPLFKRYFIIVTDIFNHHIKKKYILKADRLRNPGYISKVIQTKRERIPRMRKQCELPPHLRRSTPQRHRGVLGSASSQLGREFALLGECFHYSFFMLIAPSIRLYKLSTPPCCTCSTWSKIQPKKYFQKPPDLKLPWLMVYLDQRGFWSYFLGRIYY